MNQWELVAACVLNMIAATRYALAGDYGMALTFGAYAVAVIGFLWKGI